MASTQVENKLAERYQSMKFGHLGDEDTKNLIQSYVKPEALTQEQADEMVAAMYHLREGEIAPDAVLYTLDGEEVSLYSLLSKEKPNVINFGTYR